MSSRPLAAALIVAAAAALAVAWGVGRDTAPSGPRAVSRGTPEARPSPLPAIDPRGLRDVFRYADEPAGPGWAEPGATNPPAGQPLLVTGPRLVGLLWRGERLVAALAIDGAVLLAGPGETVAGITVVSVDGEAVRIRRSDGTEETLTPP